MGLISITLLLFGFAGLLLYIFLVYDFDYWKKRGVIGPKPRPLFGNTPNQILQKRNPDCDICDIYRGKDRFVGIFNIRKPQLLILDPKLVQTVLITNFKNFGDNSFGDVLDKSVDPLLAQNPFLLSGEAWKERRGQITPALTINRIKASYPIMLSVCSSMTNYLERQMQNKPVDGIDARKLTCLYTSEVVSNCIYGIEAGAFKEGTSEIYEMGSKIFDQSFGAIIYLVVISAIPKFLRRIYKRPFVPKEIETYFTQLMREAIAIRKTTKSDRVDFLNYLLQLQEKKNLSDLDMAALTLTFFLDGFDTSSVLIANCLRCLADHPDVQQKLREELDMAAEENGQIPFEKLQELPYLDQCINECLRLYTPLMNNAKVCTEPCEILNSKDKVLKIEKGTTMLLPYYALHHDSEYYDKPDEFIPERFSPENGGAKMYKDMGVFYPFGDGPRICLGMRFALCQSKAAIVEIVRSWKISLNPKTNPKFVLDPKYFLCAPKGGTWLDFEKIKN